jgi:FkbM family methyltransferase
MKDNIDRGSEKEDSRWENFTGTFIEEIKRCRVFVDVGAEWGFYSYLAVKYSPDNCKIFAFEPEPIRYELLKDFFKYYKNVSIYPLAVAEKKESRYIAKPQAGVSATLDLNIAKYPGKKGTNITINTITLDDFFKNSDIDVIKMDIEGAEVLAFQGMTDILKKQKPVIFLEMHPHYIESLRKNGIEYLEKLLKENHYCAFNEQNHLTTLYSSRIVLRPYPFPTQCKSEILTEGDLLRKGIVLFRLGKYEESKKNLEKAIKNRNPSPEILFQAYFHLALISRYQKKKTLNHYFKEALKVLLIKKGKNTLDIYRVASVYKSMNRLDLAEKWFKKLLGMSVDHLQIIAGVYYHLGEIQYFKQNWPGAKEYFKKCFELNPGHKKAAKYLDLME